MRGIELEEVIQEDGSTHQNATNGCALNPCVVVPKNKRELPVICDHLFFGFDKVRRESEWQCNKVPCQEE